MRWLELQGLSTERVTLADLERYMGAVGAEYAGPFGLVWRAGKRPYQQSTLEAAASCLKRFYLHQGSMGINRSLVDQLDKTRLPTKVDRNRMLLGHNLTRLPANPLTPKKTVRVRHPKLPPEGARDKLLASALTARDRLVVTWLADGGFRIGELCGLHLIDLHLREGAQCGQCRPRHVHICHREANANRARAKTKYPWWVSGDVVTGGLIRRVSPAMVHAYFDYVTTEYPQDAEHGMLLVQLAGPQKGRPWTPTAARGVLARAGERAGIGKIRPHSFRHQFATDVLRASGGNAMLTREAGGWASATTVEKVYGHIDADDPDFIAAMNHVWGQS